jgi:hypothetical protein
MKRTLMAAALAEALLLPAPFYALEAVAMPATTRAASYVCQATGYYPGRNSAVTVSGGHSSSIRSAQEDALAYCSKRYNRCSLDTCW